MSNLTGALQELRAERTRAQSQVTKLDQAISMIESLNGTSGSSGTSDHPKRVISAASRRKMALAQQARWAKAKNSSQPAVGAAKKPASPPVKRSMSAASRKRIAAFQKARWAKIKAGQKKAA